MKILKKGGGSRENGGGGNEIHAPCTCVYGRGIDTFFEAISIRRTAMSLNLHEFFGEINIFFRNKVMFKLKYDKTLFYKTSRIVEG